MIRFCYGGSAASVRFLLAAWVGAAALFVITSVAEQTSSSFASVTRDQLATIRFPLYYRFGFLSLLTALAAGGVAVVTAPSGQKRKWIVTTVLTALSAALMAADYHFIYQPLQALIIPPGNVRTTEFQSLHNWSRYANQLHVGIAMFAAILSSIPRMYAPDPEASKHVE